MRSSGGLTSPEAGQHAELAATWWGHSFVTVELGGIRVATDPLMSRRLAHLRRDSPAPPGSAASADLVVVSHLHYDHLHVPSLREFAPDVPVIVPAGARAVLKGAPARQVIEVAPGQTVDVAGVQVEVLPAHHDGRRHTFSSRSAPALGFRFAAGSRSCWYPGDTGLHEGLTAIEPVDLGLIPIGGWGPTLGEEHLDPETAAAVLAKLSVTWSLAVHYGTFWPMGMRRLSPASHRRLFQSPPARFRQAVLDQGAGTAVLTPAFGTRVVLAPAPSAGI